MGKLPEDITKQVIYELSGLNSTSYVRNTCNIDLPINNKTKKFKGFAFIRAPARIIDELNKLSHTTITSLGLKRLHQLEKGPIITLQMNLEGLP